MTLDEFKVYLANNKIILDKITKKNVYLRYDISGFVVTDKNILPVDANDVKYNIRADWVTQVTPDTQSSFKDLILDNYKIYAIKELRVRTGLGLKESKDIVDKYWESWYTYIKKGE
jgi:ribosomal protein L7/L12